MKRKFTVEQEERIAQLLTRICVSARITCHIQWELQYFLNELNEMDVDTRKVEDIKNRIFRCGQDMRAALIPMYNKCIPSFDRPDVRDPILTAYDKADGLLDTDLIIKSEAEKIYESMKLRNWDECEDNESKID